MGYTKNAISGFSLQTALKVFTSLTTVIKIMFVARILSPDDFGLFALVTIALGIAESTTQTGVNVTIIQAKQSVEYFLDTAWVIAIGRGFLIGILMILMSFGMSSFYEDPKLQLLITLAALVPMIKGFINPAIVSMQKNLEFLKDSVYRYSLVLVEAVSAVVLAFLFQEVYILIFSLIISAIFEVFISFLYFKNRPRFAFISNRAKTIFGNAKGLSILSLLNYLNENIDDFIFGKFAGTYNLGLYHNAYALGHKTNYEFAKSVNHSTLPVYTKIVEDKERLKKAFLKSITITLVLVFALSLPVLLFPELIVNILLGKKWLDIAPILHFFVFAGIIHSLVTVIYTFLLAKKEYFAMNLHLFLNLLLLVSLLYYFTNNLSLGVTGAGQALLLSRLLALPLLLFSVYRIFNDAKSKQ